MVLSGASFLIAAIIAVVVVLSTVSDGQSEKEIGDGDDPSRYDIPINSTIGRGAALIPINGHIFIPFPFQAMTFAPTDPFFALWRVPIGSPSRRTRRARNLSCQSNGS